MNIDFILSLFSGLIHIVAFAIYNKQMIRGESVPNKATWTLWAFLTVLNGSSYLVMSHDLIKSLLPIISSLACLATFLFALTKGKMSKLDKIDKLIFCIGFVAIFVWWYFKSATYANLVLQVSIPLSFIPTFRSVYHEPKTEKPLPWFLWASAYIFSLIVVSMRWQGQIQDLVYPINCLILHAGVGILALRKK